MSSKKALETGRASVKISKGRGWLSAVSGSSTERVVKASRVDRGIGDALREIHHPDDRAIEVGNTVEATPVVLPRLSDDRDERPPDMPVDD